MFKTIREKAGYISIETVVVAGLMLCLGAFIIGSLFAKGQEVNTAAMDNIDQAIAVAASLPTL